MGRIVLMQALINGMNSFNASLDQWDENQKRQYLEVCHNCLHAQELVFCGTG